MSGRVRRASPVVATAAAMATAGGQARVLEQVQAGAREQTRQLADVPLLNGIEVTCALEAAAVAFAHKLGRKPRGWFVTDIDADATVWRTEAFDAKTITLEASATANAKVWVF